MLNKREVQGSNHPSFLSMQSTDTPERGAVESKQERRSSTLLCWRPTLLSQLLESHLGNATPVASLSTQPRCKQGVRFAQAAWQEAPAEMAWQAMVYAILLRESATLQFSGSPGHFSHLLEGRALCALFPEKGLLKRGCFMNKKERVDAALRDEAVDRVPASMWGHDFAHEWSVQSLTDATIENFTRYDWDYVKVNPRASYHVEDWQAKYRPAGDLSSAPVFESSPIRSTANWKRLRQLEPDHGVLGEQLRVLQLLNHAVGYDAYFLQTIFCPLGIAEYLVGGKEPVLQSISEDRKALHTALRVITETFIQFAIASLEQGASGIFYATNGWARQGVLSEDLYREYGEQYDREFLDAIKSRSKFTVLHNCGSHIYFDMLSAYPVQAVNWDANAEGNPDLGEGKKRSGKAVMGGVSVSTLRNGSPNQVQEEVGKARESTGGTHFLLAPGCAILPQTPAKNLEAIRRALA